ncbi:hypothetical protein DB32_004207 [Sandaracinus amylolyticus]|uniref:Uncharacterized protein n=1 Tax=Sandaracinus amylolyticus TaxID=927083 RepID=A0A0F6W4G6_9BACT|nr:hypothetical protein DB32_004207 [Sandaracinus amylolyticus]
MKGPAHTRSRSRSRVGEHEIGARIAITRASRGATQTRAFSRVEGH